MRNAIAVIAAAALASTAAATKVALEPQEVDLPEFHGAATDTVWLIEEDFDSTTPGTLPDGWTSIDLTAIPAETYFHVSDYYVYEGSYAWWCGTEEALWTGYGNSWRQQLDLSVDLTSASGQVGVAWWQFVDAEWSGPEPPHDTWDGATFRVSDDGGTTWTVVAPAGGFEYQAIYAFFLQDGTADIPGWSGQLALPEWERIIVDLSAYNGQEIMLRWDFASDQFSSSEDFGYSAPYTAWFIDNVEVKNTTGTVYFEDDMEGALKPEWDAHAGFIAPSGDWWDVVDATHPQPDSADVFFSAPNGLYIGDRESSRGDGTYFAPDHDLRPLDNVVELPAVDLSADPDLETAWIRWKERISGDGAGGYVYIDVSVDGGDSWTEIEMRNITGEVDWSEKFYQITAYHNDSDVRFRLRGGTGTAEIHYLYWYVDDVELFYTKPGTGVQGDAPIAGQTVLHAASPNPFNPMTRIPYTLEKESAVQLQIFNLSGQLVRSLIDGREGAGNHAVIFDGRDNRGASLPSGVYTARLVSDGDVQTTRLLMLK